MRVARGEMAEQRSKYGGMWDGGNGEELACWFVDVRKVGSFVPCLTTSCVTHNASAGSIMAAIHQER